MAAGAHGDTRQSNRGRRPEWRGGGRGHDGWAGPGVTAQADGGLGGNTATGRRGAGRQRDAGDGRTDGHELVGVEEFGDVARCGSGKLKCSLVALALGDDLPLTHVIALGHEPVHNHDLLIGGAGSRGLDHQHALGGNRMGYLNLEAADHAGHGGHHIGDRWQQFDLVDVVVGYQGVGTGDAPRGELALEVIGHRCHHLASKSPGEIVFVHHHQATRTGRAGDDGLAVPWGDASQVDEIDAHGGCIEDVGRALGDWHRGAPGHDGHVVTPARVGCATGWHRARVTDGRRGARGVIQARFGVQDERGPVALERSRQHARGVRSRARHGHVEPGDVGECGFHCLRVEGPKARPVRAARGKHDDRGRPCAGGAPVNGGQLGCDLVKRQWKEVGELHHGHWAPTGHGTADCRAHDRRLAEGGIGDAAGELRGEPTGETEYVALGVLDVLPEDRHAGVVGQTGAQHLTHGLEHGVRRAAGFGRVLKRACDEIGVNGGGCRPCGGGIGGREHQRCRSTHFGLYFGVECREVGHRYAFGHQVVAHEHDGVA